MQKGSIAIFVFITGIIFASIVIIGGSLYIKQNKIIQFSFMPRLGSSGKEEAVKKTIFSQETVSKSVKNETNLTTTKLATIPSNNKGQPDLTFSKDGRRVAMRITDPEGISIFVNGEKIGTFQSVGHFIFSPDSLRYAFWASKDKNTILINVDGKENVLEGVLKIDPVFSSDSKKLAYSVWDFKKHKGTLIVNGQKIEEYDLDKEGTISQPVFSPDGKKLAVAILQKGNSYMVVNGQKGKSYYYIDTFHGPIFSSDSQKIVFVAWIDEGWKKFVVVNDEESPSYRRFSDLNLSFSADNQKIAYVVSRETIGSEFVVVSGQEGKPHNKIWSFAFNPKNSQAITYCASDYKEPGATYTSYLCVVEDKQSWLEGENTNLEGKPFYSPDGKQVIYFARENYRDWVSYLNGVRDTVYPDTSQLAGVAFSLDSKNIAVSFKRRSDRKYQLFINGKAGKVYDYISELSFSPDSNNVMYGALQGNEIWWMVD